MRYMNIFSLLFLFLLHLSVLKFFKQGAKEQTFYVTANTATHGGVSSTLLIFRRWEVGWEQRIRRGVRACASSILIHWVKYSTRAVSHLFYVRPWYHLGRTINENSKKQVCTSKYIYKYYRFINSMFFLNHYANEVVLQNENDLETTGKSFTIARGKPLR